MSNKNKKQKVVGPEKQGKNQIFKYLALAVIAVIGVGAVFGLLNMRSEQSLELGEMGTAYNSSTVQMQSVQTQTRDNAVVVSVSEVREKGLVRFDYARGGNNQPNPLPVLAYISPEGNLVVAVSICEPCRSNTFYLSEGKYITCGACGTQWDIETLKGVSGACQDYPPDALEFEVQGDEIIIPVEQLENWQMRI